MGSFKECSIEGNCGTRSIGIHIMSRDQPRMVYSANSRLEESESEFSADDAVDDSCDSSEDEVSPSNRPRNRMIEINNHSRKNVHTESSGKQARSSSAKRGSKGKKGTKGKKQKSSSTKST